MSLSAPLQGHRLDAFDTPPRRQGLRAVFGLGLATLAAGDAGATRTVPPAAGPLQWSQRHLQAFGTQMTLQAGHRDPALLHAALDRAVSRLRAIEAQMSLFQPDSALVRLNREGRLDHPPQDLLVLLQTAQRLAAASDGRFDVTMQPLWQLWADAHAVGSRPDADERARACARVDWRALSVTPARLQLMRPGMAVSLNGIAQGHAVDVVRHSLQQAGVQHALIDCGEWSGLGSPDGGEVRADAAPWRIGLAHPQQADHWLGQIELRGMSLAYSTDAQTRFSRDGRDHHIIDPRSGLSPSNASAVAVLASSCTLADALTKVFFMASEGAGGFSGWVARASALCKRWQVRCVLLDKQGRRWASAGLRRTGA